MLDADIAVVGSLEEIFNFTRIMKFLLHHIHLYLILKRDEIISNELVFFKTWDL